MNISKVRILIAAISIGACSGMEPLAELPPLITWCLSENAVQDCFDKLHKNLNACRAEIGQLAKNDDELRDLRQQITDGLSRVQLMASSYGDDRLFVLEANALAEALIIPPEVVLPLKTIMKLQVAKDYRQNNMYTDIIPLLERLFLINMDETPSPLSNSQESKAQ
jgi:uncharacterized protein YhaN